VGSLARPSSYAVFNCINCSVPPFVTTNDAMGNLSARSRRGVEPRHGGGQSEPARCHRQRVLPRLDDEPLRAADPCIHRRRRRGYAFPYDDVHTTGYNTEDRVVDPHPTRLTIRLG